VISAEQPASRIEATLRRLDAMAGVSRERWTDRLTIVARDPELPPAGRALLRLDERGLSALQVALEGARVAGDPFGLLILDSLSRLKPADVEENANDDMSRWLGELQELAESARVYTLVIHHRGHVERDAVHSAGRGASAIGAVAQALWTLEHLTRNPRQRRLRVSGNAVLGNEIHFQVAGEKNAPGEILYFRPIDPLDAYPLDDLLSAQEELSTSELAWRIADRRPKGPLDRPPGTASKMASALRDRWHAQGLVEVVETGGRKMIRRPAAGSA
jgi:hypothetical protein